MPRTKQVRKKSSMIKKQKKSTIICQSASVSSISSVENDELIAIVTRNYESKEEFIKEFDKFYNKKCKVLNEGYEAACETVKSMMKNMRDNLPPALKNKCINDEISEDFSDENTDVNNQNKTIIVPSARVRPSRSRTPVDCHFKRPKSPLTKRGRPAKRSQSASTISSSSSKERFKTPSMNMLMSNSVITPKVYSNTPISMMRRPLNGEVAVSMSGSPLLVGAIGSEDIPTVNVPLQDGRVFSIIPEPDAPPSDFPVIDAATRQYLKTLRAHLKILAPNSP